MHNKGKRCFFCPPECDNCLWGFDNAMSVSAPSSIINIYRCFNNFVFCEAGEGQLCIQKISVNIVMNVNRGNKLRRANWYFLSLLSSVNGKNETEKLWKWSEATEMVFLLEIHFPTSRLSTLILSKCHHSRLH